MTETSGGCGKFPYKVYRESTDYGSNFPSSFTVCGKTEEPLHECLNLRGECVAQKYN